MTLGFIFASLNALPAAESVEFSIRFFDKKIYYPDTPVQIQVSIRNSTDEPYRFRAADNKVFNLKFQIQTAEKAGIALEDAEEFNREYYNNQPELYRELSLNPGEEYSFVVESLNNFVDVTKPGLYSLSADFFPDLKTPKIGTPGRIIQSNTLSLMVRPRIETIPEYTYRIQEETGNRLSGESVPPDEVIRRTIEARMENHKEKFFLYLDLEKIMRRDPDVDAEWRRRDDTRRTLMVTSYREKLWTSQQDFRVPNEFTIMSTSYTGATVSAPATGLVIAQLKYDEGAFFQKKQYTFSLFKKNNIWMIQDYRVINLDRQVKARTGF